MNTIKILQIILGFLLLIISFVNCTSDSLNNMEDTVVNPDIPETPIGTIAPCEDGIVSFQYEILPLIVSSCAISGCHDAKTAEDDIVLDSYKNIIKEVKAGDPNDSELYESITETDLDDIMPPPPSIPLTDAQKELIKRWIVQGAKETDCGLTCNSEEASFSINIFPLIKIYCVGCHQSSSKQGGVNLDSYEAILPYAQNGGLIGTIRHDAGWSIMPPNGNKLTTCNISQIELWISEGAKDN